MVVGDLNACAAVQDHCEGPLLVARGLAEGLEGDEGFWGVGHRGYIRDWLMDSEGSSGCMVDIVRRFWPTRKGMYTCMCFFYTFNNLSTPFFRLEYENIGTGI